MTNVVPTGCQWGAKVVPNWCQSGATFKKEFKYAGGRNVYRGVGEDQEEINIWNACIVCDKRRGERGAEA